MNIVNDSRIAFRHRGNRENRGIVHDSLFSRFRYLDVSDRAIEQSSGVLLRDLMGQQPYEWLLPASRGKRPLDSGRD